MGITMLQGPSHVIGLSLLQYLMLRSSCYTCLEVRVLFPLSKNPKGSVLMLWKFYLYKYRPLTVTNPTQLKQFTEKSPLTYVHVLFAFSQNMTILTM